MITSLFQKRIEVLSLNVPSGSLGYVILPVKMKFIVWLVFYLVTSFLKRHQKSKTFIPNFLHIGQQQFQPVKYTLKGRKKKDCSDDPCRLKHGLSLDISCLI